MQMLKAMHNVEKFPFITVRIQTVNANGEHGSGTGFWFAFPQPNNQEMPLIVTNKHVLDGAARIEMKFTHAIDGVPNIGSILSISSDVMKFHIVDHPDDDVDLAAIIAQPILNYFKDLGTLPATCTLKPEHLLQEDMKEHVSPIEGIIMIGYPNGVWDSSNNMPIFRRGLTATSVLLDFEGKKQFVIDAACYPGSSGSPILLHDQGIWTGKDGEARIGSRFAFLGVLYAGPMLQVSGKVIVVDVPTAQTAISISNHMLNLGYCIKAERVSELYNAVVAY